ncbi:hypothetical protein C6P40_000221 [Pichia californica]|uniref:Uncharacterized protein n=1 Tax=Pichia californica TaxID=460514 RepID=A0A9P7BGB8_9ASCO|nr:hypothetical protein C6P42_001233 [[Candida] californica]KAG0689015.1 hypothetical protein C6P40_000221 [[Candida] californica]
MQWNNYFLQLDTQDLQYPLLLNDDEFQQSNLNSNLNLNSIQNTSLSLTNESNFKSNNNSYYNTYNNDYIIDNTSPISSISSISNSINYFDSLDNLDTNNTKNTSSNLYTNKTINITELTKSNVSLLESNNKNDINIKQRYSPILKSQQSLTKINNNSLVQSFEFNDLINNMDIHQRDLTDDNTNVNNNSLQIKGSLESIQSLESPESPESDGEVEDEVVEEEEEEEGEEGEEEEDSNNLKSKKISDSRLSLAQLSIVLNLEGNDIETAKREKNILKILKDELNFPIGEKTWIRDTPAIERERIMSDLTLKVEKSFGYGYSKKTLSIIVRRASYYMMQGRLRRERRLQRRKKSLANKQQQ